MEEHDADILTKALERIKFEFHIEILRVVDNPFLIEKEYWNGTKKWHPKGASDLVLP